MSPQAGDCRLPRSSPALGGHVWRRAQHRGRGGLRARVRSARLSDASLHPRGMEWRQNYGLGRTGMHESYDRTDGSVNSSASESCARATSFGIFPRPANTQVMTKIKVTNP